MRTLRSLWNDEAGFVISSELILVATILVIGMIAGLATVRDQVVQELADVAGAISDLDQSFSYGGITGHSSSTAGSNFADLGDFCDDVGAGQETGSTGTNCVVLGLPASEEG